MKRVIPNVSKQGEVDVTTADNQMEWWERDGGVRFLKEIGLRCDQHVLDFGCRVGHYTIPAAKVVGNEGIVYAVDKESEALNELGRKVTAHKLTNIRVTKTSAQTKLSLESRVIDVVLLYDVLHYFGTNERTKLYHEAFRVLKQGGLLSVYPKHSAEDNPMMELQHIRSADVRREILSSGFQFERRYCGIMSHDDGLNKGCVLNFRKCAGAT
ncbi:MAG: class I SAM-dependent methyltransferase [Sedimentisphaerales bacterium]|jgi:ubiquinone/menaquinone biosynthesis C-methylase UbiE